MRLGPAVGPIACGGPLRATESQDLGYPGAIGRAGGRQRDRDSYVAEVMKTGREPTTSFTMRIEGADQEVATRLKIEADGLVCIRDVTRYVDDEPWSVQTSYYPMDIAQASGLATPHDIAQGTVRAMADAGFVEVGYVDTITARMATPEEARRLDVGTGTPLIVHLRTAGTPERPTRVTRTLLPADRNRLVYKIDDVAGIQ